LYSAAVAELLVGEPHSSQNFAAARKSVPQVGHASPAVVT
jgi:hypothetical protein